MQQIVVKGGPVQIVVYIVKPEKVQPPSRRLPRDFMTPAVLKDPPRAFAITRRRRSAGRPRCSKRGATQSTSMSGRRNRECVWRGARRDGRSRQLHQLQHVYNVSACSARHSIVYTGPGPGWEDKC